MKLWHKSLILAVALPAFGAARMPFEMKLSEQLRAARLFPVTLDVGTRDRIGQTSSAVALGGLRTLVATFLNLRAFTFFTEQRWPDVGETYDTIVDLAPRTRYYWETGSWHQAYNAAPDYMNDKSLPPLRRREAWRASIQRGRAFLERGIRNNPDDWSIRAELGYLLSNPYKFKAFRDPDKTFLTAAEAFLESAEARNAPAYVRRSGFYSLARVKGREAEALALAHELYDAGPSNRTPTVVTLMLVLEAYKNPDMDVAARAIDLFKTPEWAYDALCVHWRRTRENFPIYGVASGLESLEKRLAIPAEKSIFNQPMPAPPNLDDMFQN